MVAQAGLTQHVTFAGWKQPEEMAQLLREADALVHPARWEPYGVVVLEAMAAGLPVLGSEASGAVMDRVVPGLSGFIHTVGDEGQLARHMLQIAKDTTLLDALQQGARRKAEAWPAQRGVDLLKSIMLSDT